MIRPCVVAPALLAEPRGQSFLTGLPFHRPERSTRTRLRRPGSRRLIGLQRHGLDPRRDVDADWPSTRVTKAFLTSGRRPRMPRKRFTLPCCRSVLTALTLTLNRVFDSRLDLRLAGVERHLEGHLVVLRAQGRLLGHHRRAEDLRKCARATASPSPACGSVPCSFQPRLQRLATASLVNTRVSRRRMS